MVTTTMQARLRCKRTNEPPRSLDVDPTVAANLALNAPTPTTPPFFLQNLDPTKVPNFHLRLDPHPKAQEARMHLSLACILVVAWTRIHPCRHLAQLK
jgi:hypothetical protein